MSSEAVEQQSKQRLRLRRLVMAIASYACTLTVLLFAYLAGFVPPGVAAAYFIYVLLNNAIFAALILSGANLRFARPDMTFAQVISSVVPGLVALYYVETPEVRAAFLLLTLIPLIFAILGLNRRDSILAGALIFAGFALTYLAILGADPETAFPRGEAIVLLAFFFCVLQISLLGGFISNLHRALARSNRKLSEAVDKIEDLAIRDELTRVHNRRYLIGKLQEEVERCKRSGGQFSVAIFDVDHFKSINDTFGHTAGDEVLTTIAQAIAGSVRRIDHFGRFGGEEFMLIMPATELDGALQKTEQIRAHIAALDFPEQIAARRITISAGVANFSGKHPESDVINEADTALYAAKKKGRNCVMAAANSMAGGAEHTLS